MAAVDNAHLTADVRGARGPGQGGARANDTKGRRADHPIQGEFRGSALDIQGRAAGQVGHLSAQVLANRLPIDLSLEGHPVVGDGGGQQSAGALGRRPGRPIAAAGCERERG